jgi:AsmA protein
VKAKLSYLAIAVGVLLLILISLPFLIGVNAFRPIIEQQLSSAVGRDVKVGNLSLSLLSSALAAEDLSISDDPNFSKSPFLTAKSIKVGVELWPLIASKNLNITGLTIEKPDVILVRNREGRWNFSTLATDVTPHSDRSVGTSAPQVVAKSSGSTSPQLRIAKLKLEKGRVTVGSTVSERKSVYDNVDMEATNLAARSQFPVMVTAKLPGGGYLKADGRMGPLHQADTSLSALDLKVTIGGLDLGKTGFVDPGAGIAGILDVTNRLQSNNGRAHAQGSMKINKLQLAKGGAPSKVPVNVDFNIDYDLPRSAGVVSQGNVKVDSSISHLTGSFDCRGESTVLDMKLDGQNLPVRDVQAALPAFGVILPKDSSLKTGSLNANLNLKGPVGKLVTSGTLGLFNAKLEGFDMGSKLGALSAFSGIQRSAGDTSIQKLTTNLRVSPEGTQATNLELLMPAIGQLNGGGSISSSNALNFKMVATLNSQSGMASAMGSLTGRSMSKNARVPFLIQGTTSDPKFVPDVGGMVGGAVESELGNVLGNNPQTKGLGDALDGLLGGKKKSNK